MKIKVLLSTKLFLSCSHALACWLGKLHAEFGWCFPFFRLLLLLVLRILTIFEFSTLVCILFITRSSLSHYHRKVGKHFVRTSTSTTFIQFTRNEYANGVTSENSVFGKLEISESRTWNYIASAMCAHCVPYVFSTGCSIYAWKCHHKSRTIHIYIYIDFWMRWVSIARHTTPHQRVWEQPARANQLARTHIRECYCDDEKHRPLYCILTFHSQFFSNNHHHIISCCRAHLGTIY